MGDPLPASVGKVIEEAYRSCLEWAPAAVEVSAGTGVAVAIIRGALSPRDHRRMRSGRAGDVRRGRRADRDRFVVGVEKALTARLGKPCSCTAGEVDLDGTMTLTVLWTD